MPSKTKRIAKKSRSVVTKNHSTNVEIKTQKRRLKKPSYKSFRLNKKIRSTHPKLPSTVKMVKQSFKILFKSSPKVLASILFLYLILAFLLVRGGAINDHSLVDLKDFFTDQLPGFIGQTATGAGLTLYAASNSVSNDTAGNIFQILLVGLFSLIYIWFIRQAYANKKMISLRGAFYKSTNQLVPFLLVALVILLELIPVAIGGYVYTIVLQNGIAVELIEKILWALFFIFSFVLSFYMIISTIFALYIVSLDDVTPMEAMRSARNLVKHRRLAIILKIVIFFIMLIISLILIMIPIILFVTPLASWLLFVFIVVLLPIVHSYFYAIYRELLNE